MKKTLLSFLLFFLSTGTYCQDKPKKITINDKKAKTNEVYYVKHDSIKCGSYTFKYENHIQITGQYVDNNKNGDWTYSPNKELIINGKYQDGLKTGQWLYSLNNEVRSILNYENGIKIGKQVGYFKNNKIAYEAFYNNNGNLEGEEKFYHENGKLKSVISYKNGELHGDKLSYSENGDLLYSLTYFYNTPINLSLVTMDSSLVEYIGDLTLGNGTLKEINNKNGNIILVRNYKDSLLNGEIAKYNKDGKLSVKGKYEKGFMTDKWYFYTPNGEIDRVKEYDVTQKLKNDPEELSSKILENLFVIVDNMPEYREEHPSKFRSFINENLKYPEVAAIKGIEGQVLVRFEVSEHGEIENIRIVNEVDSSLAAEVIRVVKASPLWRPGFRANFPLRVSFTFPFIFALQ